MQSSRIGAPQERSATCSIRSRNVSSPHWMSSKTTTSGAAAPAPASSGTPRRSPPPTSPPSVSPSSERIAAAAASSAGSSVELLQHLDHRPVGDPLAVGEAAAPDDRRVDDARDSATSRDLPTPGLADDRHQLAAPLDAARAPTPPAGSRARARDRRTARPCRAAPARRAHAASRNAGTGSALPFSSSGSSARPRPRRATSASVGAPISTSPGRAACCSRAATLTASPVASRSSVPVTTSPVSTPIRPSHARAPAAHRASPPPPARAQRVVLVHHRHPEHRHHRVADELLHLPPCRSTIAFIRSKYRASSARNASGIGRLPQRRRADHVAEQHRHRLALLSAARRRRERDATPSQNRAPSGFSCPQLVQISTSPP